MRIFGFALFLAVVVLPTSSFAQGISSGSSGSASGGEVTDLSEVGGFIGGGRPDAFVGTSEIYTTTSSTRSARSTSSRAGNSRVTTPQRRTAASTAAMQRRTGTMGGIFSQGSNQTIRSLTSLDPEMMIFPTQRPQPEVDTHLSRIQGIEDSRVAFSQSPQGTTAILKGTVASDRERRVAQQLLLLEPGINRVENLLEIR